MKKTFLLFLMAFMSLTAFSNKTFPLKGTFVSPADKHILYAGRISFTNPERPAWNYPGVQIVAAFEGTSLKMMAKPGSGYFVAQIDGAEPFKVAFRGAKDSVVTLATALPDARHTVRLMYAIEGYEMYPEFWGFILDSGRQLVDAPAFPSRKIEFVGNSITCGYGNEGTDRNEHFEYETARQRTTIIPTPPSPPATSVPSTGWWPVVASAPIVTMATLRLAPLAVACLFSTNIRAMPST